MKTLNKIGHILITLFWTLLIAYIQSLGTEVYGLRALIAMGVGYLAGAMVEAAQFDVHLQGILYSKSYKALIKLQLGEKGEKLPDESNLKFAIRTYDKEKTKKDLFLNLIGCLIGAALIAFLLLKHWI